MKALRINQVIEKTGLSRSSIYALCKKGEFPKQAHLGRTIVGWLEEEVDKWLHDRFACRPQ